MYEIKEISDYSIEKRKELGAYYEVNPESWTQLKGSQ